MSKKSISELKEYFKAAKRPTESQFGDLLDSYVHLDKNLNSDFKDLNFSFPNNETNKAIDVLFGNNYINGFITIEIVGSYAYQSSVGIIKKQFQVGANPDNAVWYSTTSRVVEAEGSILDNIYIGNFEWDPSINQYKITIYHTTSTANPYNVKVSQQSIGGLVLDKVALSGLYTRSVSGQNRHFIHYNQNVGMGILNPQGKLHIGDNTSSGVIIDNRIGNIQSKIPAQIYWSESTATRLAGDLVIAPRTDISTSVVFYTNDGSGVSEKVKIEGSGKLGVGVQAPDSQLHVFKKNSGNQNLTTAKFATDGPEGGSNIVSIVYHNKANLELNSGYTSSGFRYGNYFDFNIQNDNSSNINYGAINFIISDKIQMSVRPNGNVGIGTQNPDQKLTVKGKIHAEDVIIDANIPADYVFEKYYNNYSSIREDYSMMNLDELESFVREHKHLPEIPSANNMTQNGITIGEFQMKLLQKIEELTLYVIAQHKEIEQLKHK